MKITTRSLLIISLLALSTLAAGCGATVSPTLSAGKQPQDARHTMQPTENILVGTTRLGVVVARTREAQAEGLSGISHLADDQGMLFPFGSPTRPAFWMRGMLFPIDIIWIKDNAVVGVTKQLPAPRSGTPDAELPEFSPDVDVTAALEVPAGWSDGHNVTAGSVVRYEAK